MASKLRKGHRQILNQLDSCWEPRIPFKRLFVSLQANNGQEQSSSSTPVYERGSSKNTLPQLRRTAYRALAVSYASRLRSCGNAKALVEGKRVHCCIIKTGHLRDRFLGNLLIEMYGKCGALADARSVFDQMRRKNVFTWTIMIAGYARHSQCKEAFILLQQMQLEGVTPDKVTFVSILSACANQAALPEGKRVHTHIARIGFESDVVVGTALVSMYAKCGSLTDACRMFDKMPERTVVSWNAMIAAYAQHGHEKEMLQLFQQMQLEGMSPNKNTFVSILSGFTSQTSLNEGKQMHACIVDRGFESDVFVGSALVSMYGKCGGLEDARRMFEKMPKRNVVLWTSMIAAYAQHGYGMEALQLFEQMQLEGVIPDKVTFVCILDACASQSALAEGKQMHTCVVDLGFDSDLNVGNALVNMYGNCGSLEEAQSVFDRMPERDVVSWNALIAAYAQHGQGNDAVQLVYQMQLEGMIPNKVTFVSMLSACSHAGLVDKGCHSLVSMSQDHGITPTVEHYHCMIDLLGRAGWLDEGEDLINNMPCQPTGTSWMALLAASRMHFDVERGERAAESVFALDPDNAAAYALLSSIYTVAGRQDDAAKVRQRMNDIGIKQQPGRSLIDNCEFSIGDDSHPQEADTLSCSR